MVLLIASFPFRGWQEGHRSYQQAPNITLLAITNESGRILYLSSSLEAIMVFACLISLCLVARFIIFVSSA